MNSYSDSHFLLGAFVGNFIISCNGATKRHLLLKLFSEKKQPVENHCQSFPLCAQEPRLVNRPLRSRIKDLWNFGACLGSERKMTTQGIVLGKGNLDIYNRVKCGSKAPSQSNMLTFMDVVYCHFSFAKGFLLNEQKT